GGTVAMRGISADHLGAVLSVFEQSGCRLSTRKSCITLATNGRLCNLPQIDTAPYPGFPTDAQPLLMSALASGEGETKFVENMFDSRYHHVEELCRMGASIELRHREAVISGRRWLRGAKVEGRDLRGTAALVVAALGARGISQVYGLDHLGRGYERLEYDLRSMGAEIRELKDTSHSVHTG
ncbi:MAG: UDP-N-acetylglucosamine 1-carboxyvinyltransferase, partial [Eubacteriales bacterium]